MTEFYPEIARIAPYFNHLTKAHDAQVEYRATSDALVWSDEFPATDIGDEQAIRYLLKYRTSIIVGVSVEAIKPYWDAAKQAFPEWPGFSMERCQYSSSLKSWYEKMKRTCEDSLDQIFNDTNPACFETWPCRHVTVGHSSQGKDCGDINEDGQDQKKVCPPSSLYSAFAHKAPPIN